MSQRTLTLAFVTSSCAYVRGYGARDLITELRRRPPVWATRARAWVVQPHTAKDLIALAEQRGYDIVVTTETELPAAPETPDAPAEAVLW